MALVLNEEQTLIRDTAREFCAAQAPVTALRALRDADDALDHDPALWQQMAELGWAGIAVPEAAGGTGFGWQALGAILEETGRTLTASPLFATTCFGTAALLKGSPAQQDAWLPRLLSGEATATLALEEGAHHAPWGSALAARRDGDHWVLSGEKQHVVDGAWASLIVTVARTSGEAGQRDGLTLLLVPGDTPGLGRSRLRTADARASAQLRYEDVRVPADALLGEEGRGAEILDPLLDAARIALAAEMIGGTREAFDRTLAYLKERSQFGSLIGTFQALKHRMADAFTELELSRSVVLDALSALDEGREDVPRLASLAKARAGDAADLVSREALQMHGGIGMTDEHEIGFFMKRARAQEAQLGNRAFHRDRYAALSGY